MDSVSRLSKLSTTDKKCIWAQRKHNIMKAYIAVPLYDSCCAERPASYFGKPLLSTKTAPVQNRIVFSVPRVCSCPAQKKGT